MTAVLGGGEADQLGALHDRHGPALWSCAVGLTGGDRSKAQDVVQETLLRAVRNLARLDQAGGSARGWLFTVAKRIVIDEWRAASRRPEVATDRVPEQAVADTAQREPPSAVRMLFPRRLPRPGRRHPRRTRRHREIPHPLRPTRPPTSHRRHGRRHLETTDRSNP